VDCPYVSDLGYGAFTRRLLERIHGQRVPIIGSIELTFRCNLRCVHCYVAGERNIGLADAELTFDELCGILDQTADTGCLWLLLTGGEPLVRHDSAEIYLYAKRKGFLVTLFTNGTLITPQIADLLAEYPPHSVEITLYGRTQETYERVTGVPGSFARCMRGIDLLMARDVPLTLKGTVLTLNVHELFDLKAYAQRLGVRFRYDAVLNAGLAGDRGPLTYRLPVEQVVELDTRDPDRLAAWQELCDRVGDVRPDTRYAFVCTAGERSFHIDPYGRMSICMMARMHQYDLRRGTFREGWDEVLPKVRYMRPPSEYECMRCDKLLLCHQCPGWSDLESGDIGKPVAYLCDLAHRRAEAFGFSVGGGPDGEARSRFGGTETV